MSAEAPLRDEPRGVASRIFAWLVIAGWPADQVLQVAGVRMALDEVTERREYATAGIPQYWLLSTGTYEERAKMPLAWLPRTAPSDHLS